MATFAKGGLAVSAGHYRPVRFQRAPLRADGGSGARGMQEPVGMAGQVLTAAAAFRSCTHPGMAACALRLQGLAGCTLISLVIATSQ
jgi:hypothetical protein